MEIYNGEYCVYALIFPNGKYYVGITKDIKDRWRSNGILYKKQLVGRAIKKYGWNNICHEIIASNLTKEEACNFEKLLIAKFNLNNTQYGYNKTDGGEGTSGSERPLEWRIQHSKDMMGKKNPNYGKDFNGINHPGVKPLYQITKQLDVVKRWNYIMEVTETLGYGNSNIGKCCHGKMKSAYGFYWCFEKDLDNFISKKRIENNS